MEQNPYSPPRANVTLDNDNHYVYAGFWIRVGAAIIDSILIVMITLPLLLWVYGVAYFESAAFIAGVWDFLISWVMPAIVVIIFWVYRSATPGKIILDIKIVDARTGRKPSTGQFVGRYLGYYLAMIPLFLGILWVGFDKRKQGWHDKLARTVVVSEVANASAAVTFEG